MNGEYPQTETLLDRIDKTLTSDTRWLYALFGFTFLLKFVYVLQSADSIQVTVPILDEKYYDLTAQEIASGRIVQKDAFFMGPLYAYFLGVVYGVVDRNIMFARIIQIFGGSITVVLTYLLGKKVFRPSVSLLAAVVLALYGAATFFEGQLLMMWMGTLLNMTLLYVLIGKGEEDGIKRFALAGFLLGLSALARANILIFYPVVIVWIILAGVRRRLPALLVFTGTAAATILPATLHNYVASVDFVPMTSNGGVNFYIGNSERATGIFYPPEGVDFGTDPTTRIYIERLLGKDLKPSELSRYWFDKAFRFIRSDPVKELKLLLRKTALFVNGYEIPQIESFDLSRTKFGTLRILFVNLWVLMSLGVVGMIYAIRRWKKYFLLYGYIISFAFSIILFFVTARYRVQVAPVLSLFAAFAILEVLPRSFRSLRNAFPPVALLIAVLLLTQPSIFALAKDEVLWREHIHQARRLSEVGKHGAALEEINQAVELFPDHPDSYMHRAVIYKSGGKIFQAIENYEKALKLEPNQPSVHYDLAQGLREVRLYEEAIKEYSKAIELDSLMIEAYNNLGVTYREIGQFERAAEYFQMVIRMDPNYVKAYSNLGASLAESGQVEKAITVLKKAIEVNPDYANTYKNLARVYVQAQKLKEAAEYLDRYLSMNPGDQQAQNALEKLRAVLQGDTLRDTR
ncbi:MAG: tetratricopeptide repeat protein [Candidatus Latescibacteria bacterium]|nr:tetratricopeptide repeat protein [Candidatus Latescibacterota bacterium]NIM22510.1 tetratricopeptide repeat protein [Candidatus Latescibacterota bacterium]NIM64824.1 tetratricopeptide repeat protein [Candidatus Latescibacterota bacterium]NIO01332.1 tetratricopeptide repeat protein [Candidatus Latescibacterota bacterium]NIO27821.1 tetratricopeptide repeat protein [Candidatus Latescibacterota bacterium]